MTGNDAVLAGEEIECFFQGQDRTTTRYRDLMMGRAGGSGERRGEEGLGRRGKIYELRARDEDKGMDGIGN